MNVLVTILVSIAFCLLPIIQLIIQWKKSENKKSFLKQNIFSLLSIVVIFVGCFARLIYIDIYPVGLNQDEASSAYDAWSVANYGIGRNGESFPVHFIAWGSGQNALYGYLMIPFIQLFGLSNLAIRLPMALVGCISLVIFYYFMKSAFDEKKAFVFTVIFAIFPWNLMKSRWGLESNLFPDLILWAIYAMYFGIINKKKAFVWLSGILFGISTYSYGTAYFFVPISLLFIYLSLIIAKKITIKQALSHLVIVVIVSLPMILFVIINYFNLDTIKLGPITIPKLETVRFKEITSLSSGLTNTFQRFIHNISILCTNDGILLNYTVPYGLFYNIWLTSLFIIIGFILSIRKHFKSPVYTFMNCLFIASLLLMFFVDGSINRINIIFIPLTFYIAYGIISFKKWAIIPLTIYLIFFMLLQYYYYTDYQDTLNKYMKVGFKEAITETSNLDYDKLYIDSSIYAPYIFYLMYNEVPTPYYIDNVQKSNADGMWQSIDVIDNVYFSIPSSLEEKNVYLLTKDTLRKKKKLYTNISDFNIKEYNQYVVLY